MFWKGTLHFNFAVYMYNISANKHLFECIENIFYK